MVQPIPEGYTEITPYLIVRDAASALDFYSKVFGATELFRLAAPGGKVGHAEMQIGSSRFMLADEHPDDGIHSPQKFGGTPVHLLLYVGDCDAVFNAAVAAGAKVLKSLQDQFYGDRSGTLVDPFGHQWTIATHVEDVSPEEMDRRMKAMGG